MDVVLELNSTVRYDGSLLPPVDQNRLTQSFSPAVHSWHDFRREALRALEVGFGKEAVSSGNKSIKVRAQPPRLAADVVVCMEYRRYLNYSSYAEGMTFLALRDNRWIVNYPKEHYKNGAAKSSRTGDRFKRTVRMFKNARNYLEAQRRIGSDLAPSYFVECLAYNAPDRVFQPGFQETYCSIVNWMVETDLSNLPCQNGQQLLFGPAPEQWSLRNAKSLASHLVALWNNWS